MRLDHALPLDPSSEDYDALYRAPNPGSRLRASDHMGTDDEVRLFRKWIDFCIEHHVECFAPALSLTGDHESQII